jgi:hypothetical protein
MEATTTYTKYYLFVEKYKFKCAATLVVRMHMVHAFKLLVLFTYY